MHAIERRDTYRIPDQAEVQYEIVSNPAGEPGHCFDLPDNFHLARDLYLLEIEAGELIRALGERDPALHRFTTNINRRISLLTRALAPTPDLPHAINWSVGGVNFATTELLQSGTLLALQLRLTIGVGLCVFGRVRHTRLADYGEDYVTGIEFIDLAEPDRQFLERHLLRLQSEQRRAQLREQHFE